MKTFFTLMALAIATTNANAQLKWCIPEDFVKNEAYQTLEAKQGDQLIATLEFLSSPTPDNLYEEMKDENGDKMLDAEGKPMYDESKPKNAWSVGAGPESNQSIDILESGFNYYVHGMGNPVLSQDEGWVYDEGKSKWSYKVSNAVYWTPSSFHIARDSLSKRFNISPKVYGGWWVVPYQIVPDADSLSHGVKGMARCDSTWYADRHYNVWPVKGGKNNR